MDILVAIGCPSKTWIFNYILEAFSRFLKLKGTTHSKVCLNFVEVGILTGTGLAIWSDLFPRSNLYGLDIDPNIFKANEPELLRRGGFKNGNAKIHKVDQYTVTETQIRTILKSETIDVCIDDGAHTIRSILTTFEAIKNNLSKQFIYIVEDNYQTKSHILDNYNDVNVTQFDEVCVITPLEVNLFENEIPMATIYNSILKQKRSGQAFNSSAVFG